MDVDRFDSPEAVAERAAELVAETAHAALTARGCFIWALSGGRTPALTYSRLAQADYRGQIPWRDTVVVWTDERCVPSNDKGSNYRMAAEALLNHVPIPADNILRIRGEDCALAEDQRYEQALHRLLQNPVQQGRLDLVLLGAGDDGHTASLFPNSVTLAERHRWVLPAVGPEPYPHRITLTLPLINAARRILVLATGASKAPIVRAVLRGEADKIWPIALVQPRDGGPTWLVDRDTCA